MTETLKGALRRLCVRLIACVPVWGAQYYVQQKVYITLGTLPHVPELALICSLAYTSYSLAMAAGKLAVWALGLTEAP